MKDEIIDVIPIGEEYEPILIEEECKELKPVIVEFVKCYEKNKDRPVEEWMGEIIQEKLPERSSEEVQEMTRDIVETLETSEASRASLSEAIANGRSKESWFASEVKKAASSMSNQEAAKYLSNLDDALQSANEALHRTITTKAGAISQNPNLDGFIAEQYHVQTFNMNAEATGSPYRAKVLEPDGKGYSKNGVDVVIVDANGKIVKRYQFKYCKDAKSTEQAFGNDYRGQGKVVPEGQDKEMSKKASDVIEAPDGTTSNALSKSEAERMRDEAQSGNWNDLNWNEYSMKDLTIGIGKQAGYAALQGAAIGVGFNIAQKLWDGEEIEADEVVETALTSGADFGIKAAASGALKVGVEKEIVTVIPKGTPAGTIANIAYVAIEDAKVLGEMATGELSPKEGLEKLEQTTVSTVAGLAVAGKGATIGAVAGAVFGPVGAAVGGFIGGTVGYMAGSKVGETIVKGAQKIRDCVCEVASTVVSGVCEVVSGIASGVGELIDGFFSIFS